MRFKTLTEKRLKENPEIRDMAFTEKFDKEDFYLSPEGFIVFTAAYHLKRGYCCENNCRHCPYKKKQPPAGKNQEGKKKE